MTTALLRSTYTYNANCACCFCDWRRRRGDEPFPQGFEALCYGEPHMPPKP